MVGIILFNTKYQRTSSNKGVFAHTITEKEKDQE